MSVLIRNRHAVLIVAVTLVALLLNGATTPGARQLVLILMAGTILLAPPESCHGWRFGALVGLALASACIAFLPASWFTLPAWRATVAGEIGIALPTTVSPQPWLSADAVCLFAAGLAWLYYLTSRRWTGLERRRICHILAAVSITLGACYIALKASGTHWPEARYNDQFGPFPNQNQTASLFLLGGILCVGMVNRPGRSRGRQKVLWGIGTVILVGALAAVGSRTAIVLFVIAAVVISLRRATLPALAITGSALLLTVSGLILSEAEILDKFSGEEGVIATASENGRWALYTDSWNMLREAPLTGTGIGNFEDVFALHRDRSSAPNRALHPDSDFVWASAELGIPAVLLVGALILATFAACFPLRKEPELDSRRDHSMRITCVVAAAAFASNSLVDVPAHRLGSLLLGILLLALALHPRRKLTRARPQQRIALAAFAIAPAVVLWLLPRPAGLLDANAYFANAQSHLAAGRLSMASDDFERARYLRPHNAKLALDEGRLWIDYSPQHTTAAWREALNRAASQGRSGEFYQEMHKLAGAHPALHEDLWLLADGKPDLQLISIDRSEDDEIRRHKVQQIFAENPQLAAWNRDQIAGILERFTRSHRSDALLELIDQNREWETLCWRPLSAAYASNGDHSKAFQLINRSCPTPDLSVLKTQLSLDTLRAEHQRAPHNLTAAIRLAHQHMRRSEPKRALEILRGIAAPSQDSAPITHYMIAHCLAQLSEHQQANEVLITYVDLLE